MTHWNERLITRARAANLCGTWQLKMDLPYLRCSVCDGNITRLPDNGKLTDLDYLISMTLGHMVKCHNYTLSGGEQHGVLASEP